MYARLLTAFGPAPARNVQATMTAQSDRASAPAAEERVIAGGVGWRVYAKYFQATGGVWAVLAIGLANILLRVATLSFDYYAVQATNALGTSYGRA
jgi:hypothetical protein